MSKSTKISKDIKIVATFFKGKTRTEYSDCWSDAECVYNIIIAEEDCQNIKRITIINNGYTVGGK